MSRHVRPGGLAWFIARHYLGAGRGRGLLSLITWIALGGVIVGVSALVVVIAVMTGMQEDLKGKILDSSPHILVQETGTSLRLKDWPTVVEAVRQVEGVTAAAPWVLTQVSVIRSGAAAKYAQSAHLYGVHVAPDAQPSTEMERRIVEGAFDLKRPESGLPPLLMGIGLADRMQLFPGDTVVVVAFENLSSNMLTTLSPEIAEFEVTGTFQTGMYDYDMQNVYTTLDVAQDLVGITDPGVVGGLGVRTSDPDRAAELGAQLGEHLGYPYWVVSWEDTNNALFSALKLEKIAMGLILGLIVVVAAFNIVSTLVMVVADRTREIGILKAMGMTRKGILHVFVLQGAWIGVTGTVFGTVLGVVLAVVLDRYELIQIPPSVYFVDHLPVSLRFGDVAKIVTASIVIAFLATIYPALRASRLEPVDAIRHD